MPKKTYRKRKSNVSIPLIFAGILVIGLAFVFSLHTLSNSGVENEPQEETLTRQQFIDQFSFRTLTIVRNQCNI